MLDRLRRRHDRRPTTMVFCDRCGQACDAACRARALRQRQRARALTLGRRW